MIEQIRFQLQKEFTHEPTRNLEMELEIKKVLESGAIDEAERWFPLLQTIGQGKRLAFVYEDIKVRERR